MIRGESDLKACMTYSCMAAKGAGSGSCACHAVDAVADLQLILLIVTARPLSYAAVCMTVYTKHLRTSGMVW